MVECSFLDAALIIAESLEASARMARSANKYSNELRAAGMPRLRG